MSSRWYETLSGQRFEVVAQPAAGGTRTEVRNDTGLCASGEVTLRRAPDGGWLLESGGVSRWVQITEDRDRIWLSDPAARDPRRAIVCLRRAAPVAVSGGVAHGSLRAPMAGRVVFVGVEEGATVAAGDALVILEAMKMEHVVRAPHAGRVARVCCEAGRTVDTGAELVVITED